MKAGIIDHSEQTLDKCMGEHDAVFGKELIRKLFYRMVQSENAKSAPYKISNSLQDIITAVKLHHGFSEKEVTTYSQCELDILFITFMWGRFLETYEHDREREREKKLEKAMQEFADSVKTFGFKMLPIQDIIETDELDALIKKMKTGK